MLRQAKLTTDGREDVDQLVDQRTFAANSPVAISAVYENAVQGDRMDVLLMSGGAIVNRCNSYNLVEIPAGSAWCQFAEVGPGDYVMHLSFDGVEVGSYPFTVNPMPPAITVTAPPSPPDGNTAARGRVLAYFNTWSLPNTIGGPVALEQYYANSVNYYGRTMSVDEVLNMKRTFSATWPVRSYLVRPYALTVNCPQRDLCNVQGLVDWIVSNPVTGTRSVGVSQFNLDLRDGLIEGEGGRIISRG